MKRFLRFSCLTVAIVIGGCASAPLVLIPRTERFRLAMPSFADLTGAYDMLPTPLDSVITAVLDRDTLEVFIPQPRGQLVSDPPTLKICSNPLILWTDSLNSLPDYTLQSEVERLDYVPLMDVDQQAIVWLGMIGVPLSGVGPDDMCAYVQYRCKVVNPSGAEVGSFLVRAASAGDVRTKSRQRLFAEANSLAACEIAWRVAELVTRFWPKGTEPRVKKPYADPTQLKSRFALE